jgi:MFS family permease
VVEAGQWLGLVIIPSGLSGILLGGLFGDWVVRRGYENGRVMVMAGACLVTAPFAILYPVVDDPNLMLVLLFFFFFFTSFVGAAWMATMPQIVPNQMRGLSIAIAVVINNLIGMGIGPTLIAVITDYVFKDEMALRYSLSIACGGSLLLAALIFLMVIGSYSRSLRYRENWQDTDGKSA